VRVRDVLPVPEVVQLRAFPVLRDLSERPIEMEDLSRAIAIGTSAQETSTVVGRDNRIEQAPLGFITDSREKSRDSMSSLKSRV
jgi:hypothetical protein